MGNLPKHRVTLERPFFSCGDVLLSVPGELPSTSNHRVVGSCYGNIKRGFFWKKWSSEFISSLQPRKKWQDAQPNLKEDDIILIKEEGPPGTWPMARVLQVHPGNDGLVRVATVKTQDSVLNDLFINFTNFLYIRTSSYIGVGDFMDLIKNCDRYKNDPDSVHELANLIIERKVKIDLHELNTKRDVLSTITRIYDPQGLLGPGGEGETLPSKIMDIKD
ncbi:integrase catalytic domain-containing protein [Trichonephila clavipes]|nr:integrase catalytic domain-containing protein [Trichonephila clavipes]